MRKIFIGFRPLCTVFHPVMPAGQLFYRAYGRDENVFLLTVPALGLLCQSFPCRTLRPAIPLLRRLRLVHPGDEEGTDLAQYPSHPHRLSGRGNDHPEPASIPARTLPHHGAALRTDEYRSPSCLVRITGRDKEIAQISRTNILCSRKTYTLWESPLYPALYSIGVSTQNIPMFSPKTSGCNGAKHPHVLG